ncbi:formate/nitrite transporter family protein [candidate division TA06 bacterium]|uniref:Formate/nitrite transporter family protein n=1 Tax=candidate division TA06 bacterium TaxID=2250710 RepID=A0A660S9H8_UNCT6|nr:MAG: formate/nitrite transporter family protein [candidate division TA06 bacterium]
MPTNFECKNPATIAETLSESVCVKKTNGDPLNIFILAIFAGVYIAFGAELMTVTVQGIGASMGFGMAKLLGGAVFSVGLMLVVIAGAELFTGNNLMVLSALDGRVGFGKVLGKWGLVYLGNFIGSLLLVAIMYGSGLWKMNNMGVGVTALKIATAKVNLPFWEAFFRGVGCNWLVCLAVWMSLASRNIVGKIFAIFFPIMAFVASGFEHSIANMYFIPMGIFLKGNSAIANASSLGAKLNTLNWGSFIVNNEIPVTLGNIVGGAFFVGTLYWFVFLRKKS